MKKQILNLLLQCIKLTLVLIAQMLMSVIRISREVREKDIVTQLTGCDDSIIL